eukprot:2784403-Rhodomonas_salina.1
MSEKSLLIQTFETSGRGLKGGKARMPASRYSRVVSLREARMFRCSGPVSCRFEDAQFCLTCVRTAAPDGYQLKLQFGTPLEFRGGLLPRIEPEQCIVQWIRQWRLQYGIGITRWVKNGVARNDGMLASLSSFGHLLFEVCS